MWHEKKKWLENEMKYGEAAGSSAHTKNVQKVYIENKIQLFIFMWLNLTPVAAACRCAPPCSSIVGMCPLYSAST